jgi:hypothetical protein
MSEYLKPNRPLLIQGTQVALFVYLFVYSKLNLGIKGIFLLPGMTTLLFGDHPQKLISIFMALLSGGNWV